MICLLYIVFKAAIYFTKKNLIIFFDVSVIPRILIRFYKLLIIFYYFPTLYRLFSNIYNAYTTIQIYTTYMLQLQVFLHCIDGMWLNSYILHIKRKRKRKITENQADEIFWSQVLNKLLKYTTLRRPTKFPICLSNFFCLWILLFYCNLGTSYNDKFFNDESLIFPNKNISYRRFALLRNL